MVVERSTPTARSIAGDTEARSTGVSAFTWAVVTGSLPTGLALNASTGVISGTPTGFSSSFSIKVTDVLGGTDTQALSITVNPAITQPVGATLPECGLYPNDGLWTFEFDANPPYTYFWSITNDTDNIFGQGRFTLDEDTGLMASTPLLVGSTGVHNFTVNVALTSGGAVVASRNVSIRVVPYAIIMTPATLGDGVVGYFPYSATFAATGGTSPYTFTLDGDLPPGLTMAGNHITGTPTTAGTYTFVVYCNDSAGNSTSTGYTLKIYALPTIKFNNVVGATSVDFGYFPGNNSSPSSHYSQVSAVPTEPYTWTLINWTGGVVSYLLGSGATPNLTVIYPPYYFGARTIYATVQCKDASGNVIMTVVLSVINT